MNASDKKRGKRKGKGRKKTPPPVDPAKFWGDSESLPEPIDHVNYSPDVAAVVFSLGRIPIPPHETAAEHSFKMVYQRAGMMATALATASGLDGEQDR